MGLHVPVGGLLVDRGVFLSASVPSPDRADRYRRVPDAAIEIEEAVISLARAVFAEGGQLVFGGHPTIAPLVALVAGEYIAPEPGEVVSERRAELERGTRRLQTPVVIYQSRAFESSLPRETIQMESLGYATIHLIEETPERIGSKTERDAESLRRMRIQMISETKPLAMVCIGGMEGVEDEQELFRGIRPGAPVYVLEQTGGAAAILASTASDRFRVFDREILRELAVLETELQGREDQVRDPEEDRPTITPYPLIMQLLVRDLSRLAL